MDNKKVPTEKEIQDMAKKVDKLVKKTEKFKSSAPAAAGSSSNQDQSLMKQQLRQLMENMALMEQAVLEYSTCT
ncbi:hypothetical protein G6F56_013718 [Rhizopus delemar]|nr:hypothetical protein G6F56_013718 [Rhizopus delemar]